MSDTNITREAMRQRRNMTEQGRRPTHWLMAEATWYKLALEHGSIRKEDPKKGINTFYALPVFFEHGIAYGKILLSDTKISDRLRERELIERAREIRSRYEKEIKGIYKEMQDIVNRRPPVYVIAADNLSEWLSERHRNDDSETEDK